MNVLHITEGWLNVARAAIGIANPNTEALAKIRGEICIGCDKISTRRFNCMACGCSINAKVRSEGERCPLGKW